MLPEMTIEMTTTAAMEAADVPEEDGNVERAISIVLSANKEQMEKILEILFS